MVLDDDCNLAREIKDSVREDLLARYTDEEMTTLIDKSTILDPRFKARHLSSKEETTATLTTEAIDIAEFIRSEPARSADSVRVESWPSQKLKGLGSLLKKLFEKDLEQQIVSLTPSEQVDKEIKAYLEKPCIDYECDPLQWCSSHKDEFPIITTLAKKYLCVYGTSVPSERLFNKGRHIIGDLRNQLSPDTVNMLIFLGKTCLRTSIIVISKLL